MFKAVSALQTGMLCAVLLSPGLPQYADFLTSDCDSPPMDVIMFRSVALSSRTLRLSDTNDGAVNDLFE